MRTTRQTFEYREIPRSQIVPAPYNPRRIAPDAQRRLAENLQRLGLLTTLVWNQRSGHLVGGHQRLQLLDQMEGSTEYTLGVAVVDLDEPHERELNVFLNNTWAQGEFDPDKVLALVAGASPDTIAAMGWSPAELLVEFGAREELAGLAPATPVTHTAQDTLGPHVLLAFRHNLDKDAFLRQVDRPEEQRRMTADELLLYLRDDARWRPLE